VVNTDAHHTASYEKMRYGIRQLRRAWLTRNDVLNTLGPDEFLAALRPQP
jgi:DNA polymerase (family 10)